MRLGPYASGNGHGVTSIGDIVARLEAEGLLADAGNVGGVVVRGISDDSRRVEPGDLYCAIRGHVHDGHDFLKRAAGAGATAALVESPEPGLPIPQIRTTDSRRATSVAAHLVFGDPAAAMRLVGVTGTNGKTTTVQLTRQLLQARFATGSIGTLGVTAPSGRNEPISLTTPGPVEFARRLAWLRAEGANAVVAEISSHALAQERVAGAAFDVGVFTNLSRDHLDYHTSMDEYRAVKHRLAELVSADGVLVVNAEDPAWEALDLDPRSVRYGRVGGADYVARDIQVGPTGSSWVLVTPVGELRVELPLIGGFNISNALAAVAVAGELGLGLEEIGAGLEGLDGVPGRLEVLARSPLVLRDYAHTPEALRRALECLRPLTRGRLIVVFGCGGDRDRGKRPLMGEVAAELSDHVIVTTDNPRHEDPAAIIDEILPGLRGVSHERIEDRRKAIAQALALATDDDVVLLAGKGHETHQIVGDERRPFDEARIVDRLRTKSGGRS